MKQPFPVVQRQLASSCPHLTSEEDSHGNEKGSQKEIQQPIEKFIITFPLIQHQQISRHGQEEHPQLRCEKIQLQPCKEIF